MLLGMPDIAALKILNLNIDSIQVEGDRELQNKQRAGNTQGHRGLHKHKHSLESSNKQPMFKSSQTS